MTSPRLVKAERRHQEHERERQSPSTTRIASGAWLLPRVEPGQVGIQWRLPPDGELATVTADSGLLLRFIRLDVDSEIAAFAVRWGPLFANHAACRVPYPPFRHDHDHDPANSKCRSWGSMIPEGFEPYSIWHRYIDRVRRFVEVLP